MISDVRIGQEFAICTGGFIMSPSEVNFTRVSLQALAEWRGRLPRQLDAQLEDL